MGTDKLIKAIEAIDQTNSLDPNLEVSEGQEFPKELLYSMRMSAWLKRLDPEASEPRQLAARAQHIRRWEVPREHYPAGREGYLRWRTYLYRFHADQAEAILREIGYDEETIALVRKMVGKQGIKHDADAQLIEDVACLVFLEYYFPEFAAKNDDNKVVDIVRKTWKKMSAQGHEAALTIPLPREVQALVTKAIN